MTEPASWLEEAKRLSVPEVAQALELEPGKPASGRPTFACPACGAPTRHTQRRDKRGAINLTPDACGWYCLQCEAKGDVIHLVSFALGGTRFQKLPQLDKERVKDWFLERWLNLPPHKHRKLAPRPSVCAVKRPEPEPRYPPIAEIEALWKAARPVDSDADVARYLEGERALEPCEFAMLDLARALPKGAPLPRWARGPRGSWLETGHRVLSPLCDSNGKLRSLKAKFLGKGKSLNPAKFGVRGLVLACPLALQVLELGCLPSWWDEDVPFRLVLTEGEADYWTWATGPEALEDLGHGPATLGLFNGALPPEVAAKLPRGSRVTIAEQRDEPKKPGQPTAAEQYTKRIGNVLAGRIRAGEITVEVKRP